MTQTRQALISAKVSTAVAYVTGIFLSSLDMNIINVALPSVAHSFHVGVASVQWVVIGYILSLAVFIPASGWFGDHFGTKRVFLFALAVFVTASALCGLASSLAELVIFRVIQGIGGGMLTPVGTAMLFRVFPPSERARATRLLLLPILIAPAIAPIIGGFMTERWSWRWVFYVNVPIGIVALVFSARYLVEHRPAVGGRFDLRGFLLGGGGLTLLLYAVSQGADLGWTSAQVIVTGVASIILLGVFCRIESRHPEPLLNVGLLRDRLFRATNVVAGLNTAAFLGVLYLAPLFLQEALGQSALTSGMTTFSEAIGVAASAMTIGRIYPHLGPRRMATCGSGLLALSVLAFLFVDSGTSPWVTRALLFVIGFANSATFLAVQASMFTGIDSAETGHASAIYTTLRQSSLAVGVAILSTALTVVGGDRTHAFHLAFAVAAIFAACAASAAFLLIKDEDARSTMTLRDIPP